MTLTTAARSDALNLGRDLTVLDARGRLTRLLCLEQARLLVPAVTAGISILRGAATVTRLRAVEQT
jgi:hypothetical protein